MAPLTTTFLLLIISVFCIFTTSYENCIFVNSSTLSSFTFDKMFDGFISVVKTSPFGGMLDMFGGAEALEPLKDPFKKEFEGQISRILSNIDISSVLQQETDFATFKPRIADMVDTRLNELTPKHVKEIIEEMIRQHLGWPVVWRGVFGAFIGFLSTLLL